MNKCAEENELSDDSLSTIVGIDDRLQLDTPIYRYLSVEHCLDMVENKRNVLRAVRRIARRRSGITCGHFMAMTTAASDVPGQSKTRKDKMMKARELFVASMAALIAGCMCTTISDEYSVAGQEKPGALRYEKVSSLDARRNYSPTAIPVVVRVKDSQEKKIADSGGLHGLAWLCTVGVVPAWEALRVANKRKRLEWMMAQRKFEEAAKACSAEGDAFSDLKAKADQAIREEEIARIEKRRGELEQLLKAGKFEAVVATCEKETAQLGDGRRADKLFWLSFKMEAVRKVTEAKMAAIRKNLEERLRPLAKERIAQTLAFGEKAAEEGSVNFFGFFVGMSKYDAFALARHYGLDDEQYRIKSDGQGTVNGIWISLKGIRHLAKKGNTFHELYRVVESRVGDMS